MDKGNSFWIDFWIFIDITVFAFFVYALLLIAIAFLEFDLAHVVAGIVIWKIVHDGYMKNEEK